jgi:hypothetical protein
MIFFHNNSDHMTFTETPIGVPAVSFTNMPDHYIHSSDDDLWNVDRTQLGRNAASVALIAYIMASADGSTAPVLGANTFGMGMERLGQNLRIALLGMSNASDKAEAYHAAADQIRYAVERERLALGSLGEISPNMSSGVDALLGELERREEQAMREIRMAYQHITGHDGMPPRARSEAEDRLAALTPVLAAGPTEFLSGRPRIGSVPGLHSLMAFEILNGVNGTRNGEDIYRYVAAEAREAGDHYFGVVTPEAVLEYLRGAEDAELVRLR